MSNNIVNPGSRPRGPFTRPYSRSVQFSAIEYVLLKRWAARQNLSLGTAIRELALGGLLDEATRDPQPGDEFVQALASARG